MIGPTPKPWAQRVNRWENLRNAWADRENTGNGLAFAVSAVVVLAVMMIPLAMGTER